MKRFTKKAFEQFVKNQKTLKPLVFQMNAMETPPIGMPAGEENVPSRAQYVASSRDYFTSLHSFPKYHFLSNSKSVDVFALELEKVKNRQPHNKNIDLRQTVPSKKQLEELDNALKNNNFIGDIYWPENGVGETNAILKKAIEEKIIKNNQEYRYHPTDFIHGLLAKHVYEDAREGDKVVLTAKDLTQEEKDTWNPHLKDWKVLKIFSNTSGYYSVLYGNTEKRQLIFAHRGTIFRFKDLFKKASPVTADIKEVLGNQLGEQVADYIVQAYRDTKEIVQKLIGDKASEEAMEEIGSYAGYHLSVTGHSLGAWLAEMSAYFAYTQFKYHKIRAISFDSPGSLGMWEQLKPQNVCSKDTILDFTDIDIISYLSTPNIVNSCQKHAGKHVYRLFPDIVKHPRILNQFYNAMVQQFQTTQAISQAINTHPLKIMLTQFNPETGHPTRWEKVKDWPKMSYQASLEAQSFAKKADTTALNKLRDNLQDASLHKIIGDNTPFIDIAGVLYDWFITEKIDIRQYWGVIQQEQREGGLQLLTLEEEFNLKYQHRYNAEPINQKEYPLFDCNVKGTTDWYIWKMKNSQNRLVIDSRLSPLAKKQVKELLDQFEITDPTTTVTYVKIKPASSLTTDLLITLSKRLLDIPPIKEIIKNENYHEHEKKHHNPWIVGASLVGAAGVGAYIWSQYNKEEEEQLNFTSQIPSEKTHNFVGREKEIEELETLLKDNQIVVIDAFAGTGKSTLAAQFSKEKGPKDSIRWIKADSSTALGSEYRKFAEEINITDLDKKALDDDVIRKVTKKLADSSQKILLIFDNVGNEGDVRSALHYIRERDSIKILITTRRSGLVEELRKYGRVEALPLKLFDEEAAKQYIKKNFDSRKINVSDEDMSKLLQAVGSKNNNAIEVLPFNLSLAVKHILHITSKLVSHDKAIEGFINDLPNIRQLEQDELTSSQDPNGEKTSAIFTLIVRSIISDHIAWKLLQYTSVLDADTLIPCSILEKLGIQKDNQKQAMEALESAGLAFFDDGNFKIAHRLVQEESRKYREAHSTESVGRVELCRDLIEVFSILMPDAYFNPNNEWITSKQLYPHLESLLSFMKDEQIEPLKSQEAAIFFKMGLYNKHVIWNYEKAVPYLEKAIAIWKGMSTDMRKNISNAYNQIGLSYQEQGQHENSLNPLKESLKLRESMHPDGHSEVANSLNNIGRSYSFMDDLDQALKYHTQARDIRARLGDVVGEARSLYNMGNISLKKARKSQRPEEANKKCLEAKEYYEKALSIRRDCYGQEGKPYHIDIFISLRELGGLYRFWSTLDKKKDFLALAAQRYREALTVSKEGAYPKEHTDVTGVENDLQNTQRDLDELEEKPSIVYAFIGQVYDNPEVVRDFMHRKDDPLEAALRRLKDDVRLPSSAEVDLKNALTSSCKVPAFERKQEETSREVWQEATLSDLVKNQVLSIPYQADNFHVQYNEGEINARHTFTYHEKFSLVRSEKIEVAEHAPGVIIDEKAHAQLLHYAATGSLLPAARAALDQGVQLITHRDFLDVHHERTVTLSGQVVMDEKMVTQARFFTQEGVQFDTLREAIHTGRAHLTDDLVTEERQEEDSFDALGFLSDLWQNPLGHNPLNLLKGLAHELLHIDINSHHG